MHTNQQKQTKTHKILVFHKAIGGCLHNYYEFSKQYGCAHFNVFEHGKRSYGDI